MYIAVGIFNATQQRNQMAMRMYLCRVPTIAMLQKGDGGLFWECKSNFLKQSNINFVVDSDRIQRRIEFKNRLDRLKLAWNYLKKLGLESNAVLFLTSRHRFRSPQMPWLDLN